MQICPSQIIDRTVPYPVCVYSAHRQVLPYSSRSKARLLTATQGLPSFTLSSIPTRGLPGGLFPIILPSITYGTWSPCRRVWQSQTLCLLLITDMMALSSPSHLNTSSLQTLSGQVMFKTFLQIHISQLSSLASLQSQRLTSFHILHE